MMTNYLYHIDFTTEDIAVHFAQKLWEETKNTQITEENAIQKIYPSLKHFPKLNSSNAHFAQDLYANGLIRNSDNSFATLEILHAQRKGLTMMVAWSRKMAKTDTVAFHVIMTYAANVSIDAQKEPDKRGKDGGTKKKWTFW